MKQESDRGAGVITPGFVKATWMFPAIDDETLASLTQLFLNCDDLETDEDIIAALREFGYEIERDEDETATDPIQRRDG